MFTKVLVGVDGEQGGRDAIALAKQLGGPEASIALAHVYGAGLMPGAGAALLLAAELEESEELLERERSTAVPDAQVFTCANHSIGRALHGLAEQEGFELIVIGACRHRLIGRLLLGNDAIGTLGGAPCAVAVAPPGYAEHPSRLRTIGVGYDGSPQSEQALNAALQLRARSADSEIRALTVIPLRSMAYGQERAAQWPEAAVQLSEDQIRRLGGLKHVKGDVVFGEPSDELMIFGEQVDVLIIGSHSHGAAGRLLHGSTSHRLARHVPCPLLVLRASAANLAANSTAEVVQCSTTSS